MGSCIISFNLNCIMQLKQLYNMATKVSSRKKCYYFWWSTWLHRVLYDLGRLCYVTNPGCIWPNVYISHLCRIDVNFLYLSTNDFPDKHYRGRTTRYIPRIWLDVITCPCPLYFHLAHKSSVITCWRCSAYGTSHMVRAFCFVVIGSRQLIATSSYPYKYG